MKKNERMSHWQIILIWTGAGICLASIYAGNTLSGLGFFRGVVAILIGTILGAIPMYLMSLVGTRERVSGMVSFRPAFGIRGSYIVSVINIVQLLGWVAIMIIVTQEACIQLKIFGTGWISEKLLIGLIGLLITINACLGHNNWKWFQWFTVGATVILSVVMTIAVLKTYPVDSLVAIKTDGTMTTGLGIDSLVGLSLAWVPLVPDYSQFAENEKKAARGTFLGYAITSMWMFFVGLVCTLATQNPQSSPVEVMVALNLGTLGLYVVILSGITTAFLNVFSSGISAINILPKAKERPVVFTAGIIGTLIALFFPINDFQGFLVLLGSFFVPLEAIVLTDYFLVRKKFDLAELDKKGGKYWYKNGINLTAFAVFGVGFLIYEVAYYFQCSFGSSIISFVCTSLLYYLLCYSRRKDKSYE